MTDDEPYVIVAAADLKPAIPNVEAVLYGPWGDVDEGSVRNTMPIPPGMDPDKFPFIVWRKRFWGLNGKPDEIQSNNDVLFLVGLMENDDGSAKAARGLAKQAVTASLAASIGQPRTQRVASAIADMNSILEMPTGGPNFDDRIGSVQELKWSMQSLQAANAGLLQKKVLVFNDGDAEYRVGFHLARG
jgi:hypothetical protein